MTIITTNLQYSFDVHSENKGGDIATPPTVVVLLDKGYEPNSASTTTTNSPVISTHHLELPSCPCNQLITSNYNCSECEIPFMNIKLIQSENDITKTQLNNLKNENDLLRHDRQALDTKFLQLKSDLESKQKRIETTTQGIESLNHDLKVLKVKCKEETCQVQVIQEAKLNVEMELSELTERLKQEANKFITIEKAEQAILIEKNTQLEKDINEAQSKFDEASIQLNLIRNTMENQPDEQQQHVNTLVSQPQQQTIENTNSNCMNSSSNVIDTYTRAQVETILMHGLDMGIHMDTIEDDSALMDFNDFIQLLHKTPLRKLHSLKYMRYCVREDIEPCLRFGPNPRLASKKIMEAIMVKSCFIEECPEGFVTEQATRLLKEEATATMWERFTTSSVFLGCQACGRNMDQSERSTLLKYRFRISYFDEWACIDRYCRDRLLAVIEFYLFIRHLRAGAYKHRSLHELYQQLMRLKLQMFITRMGALPNMLQNCGIHLEKIATAFHGEDINNSVILLSDSASNFERLSSSTESTITISTVASTRTSASSS
ncbi:unnamed protein product [Mucor hiemalis]